MTRVEWDGRLSRRCAVSTGDFEVGGIDQPPVLSNAGTNASSTNRKPAKAGRRQRGASLIELAVAAPLLIILLFGIIDFGWMFSTQHELRSATREGARLAVVDNGCYPSSPDYGTGRCPTGNPSQQLINLKVDILARATGVPNPGSVTITVCYPTNPTVGISNATVTMTYPGASLSGLYSGLLNGLTLRSTAVMRIEQMPTYNKDGSCT